MPLLQQQLVSTFLTSRIQPDQGDFRPRVQVLVWLARQLAEEAVSLLLESLRSSSTEDLKIE